MSSNGRLKQSELSSIGNGQYMRKDAAKAFRELDSLVLKKYGRRLGVVSSYRTYDRQVYFWNLYLSGRGNLAARPGNSNHGLGLAIDVDVWSRAIINKHGAPYGFQKKWSDAPSEDWHFKWTSAHYNPPKPKESIYKYLTKSERYQVARLRSARKKSKENGGWSKNPSLLKEAVEAKKELNKKINALDKLDLKKLNRRKRRDVMKKVVSDE